MNITGGVPYPLGTQITTVGVNFAYVCTGEDCGVVLFDKNTLNEYKRIPFAAEYAVGNVFCMLVKDINYKELAYCFYEADKLVTDSRGKSFLGGKNYNDVTGSKRVRLALFTEEAYDWEGDKPLEIPYEQSIGYCMHVRGFTRHSSSKVKGKGCFWGIIEKIPYLKDLGVTMLELQPAYEFAECIFKNKDNAVSYAKHMDEEKDVYSLNYWGYTNGYYYAPKNSYAYSTNAVKEFKDMVKALHKNGIEVIMQFYFQNADMAGELPEILRYWLMTYHVDGFHIKGDATLVNLIAKDPVLAKTKIWYYGFEQEKDVYTAPNYKKYLAEYRDDYRYDVRRFLKGDEGMLQTAIQHFRCNPSRVGKINYLTNYDGFTLADMVSYDRKHNEANGEDNRDGTDYNAGWNCGQEGISRKKSIQALRMKQMKNALLLLFLSQGTPLIFMGDEFCNSQEGNNNPYCQDNKITWLNWKETQMGIEIHDFVKQLIALRKAHPVLRQEKEVRMLDYKACGYPDVSYHGASPWKPDLSFYGRQIGIMYCGKYASKEKEDADDFFYIAYNMHWEPYRFALPKLPKGMTFELLLCSDTDGVLTDKEQACVILPGRCICVFSSTQESVSRESI